MDENLPEWLNDLMDEYPTNRSDTAIIRLARVFSEYPAAIMQAAVDAYMRDGNKFFPKVGDLSPYVTKTNEWQEQELTPAQWYQRNMNDTRRQIQFTDDEIASWEVARGTMPVEVLSAAVTSPVEEDVMEWEELFA